MEELEKLGIFHTFFQLVGYSPFRMQTDPLTNRFRRFTFSFGQYSTWWFLFMKIWPFLITPIELFFILDFQNSNNDDRLNVESISESLRDLYATSPLLCISIAVIAASRSCDFIIIQFFLLRCSHLAKAIKWIQRIDETLRSSSKVSNKVTKHIYIGIVLTLLLVKLTEYRYWSSIEGKFVFVSGFPGGDVAISDDAQQRCEQHHG